MRIKPTSSFTPRTKPTSSFVSTRAFRYITWDTEEILFDSTGETFDTTYIWWLVSSFISNRYALYVEDLTWDNVDDLTWEQVTWISWTEVNTIDTFWT